MPLPTIEALERVKKKHKEQLMTYPNVTAVGVGPKTENGKTTGVMAIKIYVRRKIPLTDLSEDERIPEMLDGMPTDVEELAPLQAR